MGHICAIIIERLLNLSLRSSDKISCNEMVSYTLSYEHKSDAVDINCGEEWRKLVVKSTVVPQRSARLRDR